MTSYEKEIRRLVSRSRDLNQYSKALREKPIRKKVVINDFVKSKGIQNIKLCINTLKYLDFSIEQFSEVDIDLLLFYVQFTYFKDESFKLDSEVFTRRQQRELDKLALDEQAKYNTSNNWKEIRIKENFEDYNLKSMAEVFVRIKMEITSEYIKFLTRRR